MRRIRMEENRKERFNQSVEETEQKFQVEETQGLSEEQVAKNREIYGLNELATKKKKSLFVKFLEQFKDFMIIILIIAAIISGVVGYYEGEGITDSIIILIVVIVNAIIGVAQENKAEKSLEALQKLSSHVVKVMRNRQYNSVTFQRISTGRYCGTRYRRLCACRFENYRSSKFKIARSLFNR